MGLIENAIEFNPFSLKGRAAFAALNNDLGIEQELIRQWFDEDTFLKNFYVEPFTRFKKNNIENEDSLGTHEDVDYDNLYIRLTDDTSLNRLKNEFGDFKKCLFQDSARLIWLYGSAGCGKTTLIHQCGKEYSDKIHMYFCDFESGRRKHKIKDCGIQLNIKKNPESNLLKFAIQIVDLVFSIICNKIENENVVDDKKINELCKIYFENVYNDDNDPDSVIDFFTLLNRYVTGDSKIEEVVAFFKELLDRVAITPTEKENLDYIVEIMELSNILYYLLIVNGISMKKSCICVFDNIEYYIYKYAAYVNNLITDKTLDLIIKSLLKSTLQINNNFLDNLKLKYIPKFIIITRPTTVSLVRTAEGGIDLKLEITNWFCAKEIYEKKLGYILPLLENGKYKDDVELQQTILVFKSIMQDCTASKWSLSPFLAKFFNYNHRRMARTVLRILNNNIHKIIKFNKIFSSCKESDNINVRTHILHLCRLFIVRILLEEINEHNPKLAFFNKLSMEQFEDYCKIKDLTPPQIRNNENEAEKILPNIGDDRISYARYILTILNNFEMSNDSELYMSLEDLLTKLLLDGANHNVFDIKDSILQELSEILLTMVEIGEGEQDENPWVPLIQLKSELKQYNRESIYKQLQIAIKNKKATSTSDEENVADRHEKVDKTFGLKITYAGQIYLLLLANYEYFATVTLSNPKFYTLITPIKKLPSGMYNNIASIDRIFRCAIGCSYAVIQRDLMWYTPTGKDEEFNYELFSHSQKFYRETPNDQLITHPQRIILSQYNYLKSYAEYIEMKGYSDLGLESEIEKKSILKTIKEYISLYEQWKDYFINQYKTYFKGVK